MNVDLLVISSIQWCLHLPGCTCALSKCECVHLMLQKWMRRTASEGGWNVWMRCPTLRNSLWISKTSKAWTVFRRVCFVDFKRKDWKCVARLPPWPRSEPCLCAGCTVSGSARWTASWQRWRRVGQQNTWSLWQCCWRTCKSAPRWQVTRTHRHLHDAHTRRPHSFTMLHAWPFFVFVRYLPRAVPGVGEEQVRVWDPGGMSTLGGQKRTDAHTNSLR